MWMPAYLARTGLAVFAMLFAITFLTEHIADGRALVAGASAIDLPQLNELATTRIEVSDVLVAVAGVESARSTPSDIAASPEAQAPAVAPTAPAVVAVPVRSDAVVLASWYGPGFYGNRTACGQTYTPEILGVAHLTLPCGTSLILSYGSRAVTVTVIDRGPYVAGRAIDLSNATKLALDCPDLCTVRMQIAH
jgi:rare lipoprotein A (peptidoglycan hydrolase)